MKKILLLLFALMPLAAKCPPDYCMPIKKAQAIRPYEMVYQAVRQVESKGDSMALNLFEGAVGELQIRKCRLEHFNKITGKSYTMADCYNPEKSKEIFMTFAEKIRNPEQIARRWNGSGPMTDDYWRRVRAEMQKINL